MPERARYGPLPSLAVPGAADAASRPALCCCGGPRATSAVIAACLAGVVVLLALAAREIAEAQLAVLDVSVSVSVSGSLYYLRTEGASPWGGHLARCGCLGLPSADGANAAAFGGASRSRTGTTVCFPGGNGGGSTR